MGADGEEDVKFAEEPFEFSAFYRGSMDAQRLQHRRELGHQFREIPLDDLPQFIVIHLVVIVGDYAAHANDLTPWHFRV